MATPAWNNPLRRPARRKKNGWPPHSRRLVTSPFLTSARRLDASRPPRGTVPSRGSDGSVGSVAKPFLDVIGEPEGERDDGQRRVRKPGCGENRAPRDEEVLDAMNLAVWVHDPPPRAPMHPRRSHVMEAAEKQRRRTLVAELLLDPAETSRAELVVEDLLHPTNRPPVPLGDSPVDSGSGKPERVAGVVKRHPRLGIRSLLGLYAQRNDLRPGTSLRPGDVGQSSKRSGGVGREAVGERPAAKRAIERGRRAHAV